MTFSRRNINLETKPLFSQEGKKVERKVFAWKQPQVKQNLRVCGVLPERGVHAIKSQQDHVKLIGSKNK